MSNNTYILVDEDYDQREANGETSWTDLEKCKNDIVQGIIDEQDEVQFLPWRILIYDIDKYRPDMNVHSKITNIVTKVTLEMFGGGE